MSCCQCWAALPPRSTFSDKSTISCYKMLSNHEAFLNIEEPDLNAVDYLHSDEEVDVRARRISSLDTNSITSIPSIYIDQACGEPRGQQLVLDFAPTAGDVEIELRSQVYDLESSQESGSTNATSDSEAGLARAQGDHNRAQYRASHYTHGSDLEVEVKNHLPEYDSSIPIANHCSELLTNRNQEEAKRQVRCEVHKALMSAPIISFQLASVKSTVGSLQVAPETEVITYEENLAYEEDEQVGQKNGDERTMRVPLSMKEFQSSDADNNFPAVHNYKKIDNQGGNPEFEVSSA